MEGTNALSTLLETVGSLTTLVISTIGEFIELIGSHPYLLIGVSLMLIGTGVSFIKRLIRV